MPVPMNHLIFFLKIMQISKLLSRHELEFLGMGMEHCIFNILFSSDPRGYYVKMFLTLDFEYGNNKPNAGIFRMAQT